MFRQVLQIGVLLCMSSFSQAGTWNGAGTISSMYIYPNSVIVFQGSSSINPAGCAEGATWSFNWADFSVEAQSRIMAMLLTAKAANTSFQVAVSNSECGPEGKKKFNGQFNFI